MHQTIVIILPEVAHVTGTHMFHIAGGEGYLSWAPQPEDSYSSIIGELLKLEMSGS